MMDCLTDPRIERVVLMTSARIGKTQACVNNLVGYHATVDPANVLVVLPTEQRADEWAEDELDPMIRDTPILRQVFGERKSRTAKDRRKHRSFPGGRLYVVGANAPSGLAAKTIRILCCDEIDRFPASSGTEGDPISLAIKRTATVWNRKIILSSTPTSEGSSRIAAAFEESDKRRFWVPCPECGEPQTLRWAQVRWDGEDASTAAYHCSGCGAAWDDAKRWAAVRRGQWRAEAPLRRTAGFALNELYSPWRRLEETVADFLEAKDQPERLKVWVNTALGETWREKGDAPDADRLLERREDYQMGEVPPGALLLTAGIDSQEDRLECDIWAWSSGYTSWLVDHIVIRGSPREDATWDELAEVLAREWPRSDGQDGGLRVAHACIDTGGRDTAAIYGQIRRLADPRISATKGADRWGDTGALVAGPTYVDATVGGRKHRRGLQLWTVAASALKAELYGRLWKTRGDAETPPPGWVHVPRGIGAEWVRQLVAEQLVTVKDRKGFARREWRSLRERNEALDCAVLARAALSRLGSDRYGPRFWDRFARPEPEPEPPPETVVPDVPPRPAPPVMQQQPQRRAGRSSYLSRLGR